MFYTLTRKNITKETDSIFFVYVQLIGIHDIIIKSFVIRCILVNNQCL